MSSLLLYEQCFGQYVLKPSSGVSYQTCESTQNLKLNFFIWTTGVDCSNSVDYDRVQVLSYGKYYLLFLPLVGIEPVTSRWFHSQVQQETPEEGRRTYRRKCCEYNNKDKVNSLNILSDDYFFAILSPGWQIKHIMLHLPTGRNVELYQLFFLPAAGFDNFIHIPVMFTYDTVI